ncbi:baculoviral IAP repeat-containing protein 1-like [Protopterus annectens]|uniref:baculoviral IAP repeat-containing protein 1-like n=1 Tax=Protopterus annectens TaxID=7888 RepID=UPI001CFA5650|nr:baculoviral IAP repeat-containing protein 1-like [Protopterus annectens]
MENESPSFTGAAELLSDTDWMKIIYNVNLCLRKLYNSKAYRKVLPFGEPTSISTDVKYVYSELMFISKNDRNKTLENVTLPEIIRHLSNITIVLGEAGSGKSALLKKIAILWGSGCCPVLQRFKLVFHVPLSSLDDVQGLAYTIQKQLLGPNFILTDAIFKSLLYYLKNQILFLIDDYGENKSVPNCIKELIQKNHISKNCIVVTTCTNRVGSVRRFASSVFTIREFPFYSSLCVLKKLFSHDIQCVRNLFYKAVIAKTLQSILKSPLFAVAVSVSWVHFPQKKEFSTTFLFRAYLYFSKLKFFSEKETLSTVIASCQELALVGFFKSRFEFTDKDLSEAGVHGEEAVRLGLISKFTSQRLHPVYKFLHPCFQEYLAGEKLSDYLISDSQEANEKGLHILQHIDTFLKFSGQYFYFLQCACNSSKSVCKIVTHLLNMMNSSNALDAQSENQDYLKHHPELAVTQNAFTVMLAASEDTELTADIINNYFLNFVIQAAYENICIAKCCPQIQNFLKGKNLSFGKTLQPGTMLMKFLCDHPETFTLLNSVIFTILGDKVQPKLDFSRVDTTLSKTGVPCTESDYAGAYQLRDTMIIKRENSISSHHRCSRLIPRYLPDTFIAPFISAQAHKVPHLKLEVLDADKFEDHDLINLMKLFAATCHIELHLKGSKGFMEIIKPAIELYKSLFIKCEIFHDGITSEEENLLLSMNNLESLDISPFQKEELPEHIFSNINQFPCLRELSVRLCEDERRLVHKIADGFSSLSMMEKLVFRNVDMTDDSQKLAWFVQHFQKLVVFHLKCKTFPAFKDLLNALTHSKALQEIVFEIAYLSDDDISTFASILSHFSAIKILDVHHMDFKNKEASEGFAKALQSLNQLEVLQLPMGNGITAVASSIVQQFHQLTHLKFLLFNHCLTDDSLMQLANVARDGFLCTLEKLKLNANHEITDSGWKDFFLTVNNMPKLNEFQACRMYTQSLKPNPQTVRAFVQCISRLPNLVTVGMIGWLLDTEDLNMFKEMKEKHPQSKRLNLYWQWLLPFQANITE